MSSVPSELEGGEGKRWGKRWGHCLPSSCRAKHKEAEMGEAEMGTLFFPDRRRAATGVRRREVGTLFLCLCFRQLPVLLLGCARAPTSRRTLGSSESVQLRPRVFSAALASLVL